MKDATVLKASIAGSVIAAICCFTPILVIFLGSIGLSAWLGWPDYFLLPALVIFLGITVYGLWRRQRTAACCAEESVGNKENA